MRNWSLLPKKSLKKTSFLCSDTSFIKLLKENIHLGVFQNFQDMGLSEKMKEYFTKNAFFSKNSCWIYNFKLFCKQYDILQVIRGTNYNYGDFSLGWYFNLLNRDEIWSCTINESNIKKELRLYAKIYTR